MKIYRPASYGKVIGLVGIATGYLFVVAQTVTDTYDNDSLIADSWNISTSTSGQIMLADKTCNATTWHCSASTTCANYAGDGDYIIVVQADAPGQRQWKTDNSACDRPECGADGGQDGDNLVTDNTIDFSTVYPARDYCDSIDARLPTIDELECMYTNRASFGNNFGASYYWSSTEDSEPNARYVSFISGSSHDSNKTADYYVRCVRGW